MEHMKNSFDEIYITNNQDGKAFRTIEHESTVGGEQKSTISFIEH